MSKTQLWVVWKTGKGSNKSQPWMVEATSRLEARKHFERKSNVPLSRLSAMTAGTYDKRQKPVEK